MKHYVFILGTNPELSTAEILSVVKPAEVIVKHQFFLIVSASEFDVHAVIDRLGGTIKIAELIGQGASPKVIADILQQQHVSGKCNFGISFYNSKPTNIGFDVKKVLKEHGISARLVTGREPVLSSVIISKNKCQEFLVLNNKWLAKTVAVQDFEAYGERDFGRPVRDMKSGSLPPKLAQMMINLADQPFSAHVLDPFCGSGTIIQEALIMGYRHITGSDASPRAIADTKTNVAWLNKQQGIEINHIDVFQQDVRQIDKRIALQSIDAIVTEPYLGPALRGGESTQRIEQIIKELDQLYVDALKSFSKILKSGGTIVMVVPQFKHRAGISRLPSFFTQAQRLGLQQILSDELLYARSDQRVLRNIVVLKK